MLPAKSLGFTISGEIFKYVIQSNKRGSHIPSSWIVHVGCAFVGGTRPPRTWMSGCFESVRRNACVHRLDHGLHSHSKKVLGNGVKTNVKSKGEIPSTEGSQEGRTRDAATCRTASPTHYRLSYFGPNYSLTNAVLQFLILFLMTVTQPVPQSASQ